MRVCRSAPDVLIKVTHRDSANIVFVAFVTWGSDIKSAHTGELIAAVAHVRADSWTVSHCVATIAARLETLCVANSPRAIATGATELGRVVVSH